MVYGCKGGAFARSVGLGAERESLALLRFRRVSAPRCLYQFVSVSVKWGMLFRYKGGIFIPYLKVLRRESSFESESGKRIDFDDELPKWNYLIRPS